MIDRYFKSRLRRQSSEDIGALPAGMSDHAAEANAGVIEGFELLVTLQLRTPLRILQMHGKLHPGPPSRLPDLAGIADACWSPKPIAFAKLLGMPPVETLEPEAASLIGFVRASEYLPFLRAVRAVMESRDDLAARGSRLRQIPNESREFAGFWKRHQAIDPYFPNSCLYFELLEMDAVSDETANRLFKLGCTSASDVAALSLEQLQRLPRIGSVRGRRIRASAVGLSSD